MLLHIQPEAYERRRALGRRAAVEALHALEAQGLQKRLAEADRAHAAVGILPAKRRYVLKRMLDLVLAVPALLLTLPLYPLITLMVRRDSPGPGLYRQVRVGKNGRPFVAYKFRTMHHIPPEQARAAHLEIVARWMAGTPVEAVSMSPGASVAAEQADLTRWDAGASSLALASAVTAVSRLRSRHEQPFAVASFKYTGDPRITRTGRILRKLSLDELPQLINVVRGEMSLVGPRPPVPYEVERYSERALARLRVLPGLTGQWQVEGRGQVGFDEMVEMDLDYAANGSLWRDVVLILRTIPAVVRCSGAG